jgi:hypothetical protein
VDTSRLAVPVAIRLWPKAISRYGSTISNSANSAIRGQSPRSAANGRRCLARASTQSTAAPMASRPNTTTGADNPRNDRSMNRYEAPQVADSTSSRNSERRLTATTVRRILCQE